MTKFNGFATPDGFTQVPNEYLEYTYSHECDLTLVDMKIMNLYFRNTFGWIGKQQYAVVLSLVDIQTIINVRNKNQVSDSLKKLTEKKFLEKKLVSSLTKKQKSNIEKSLNKKLRSNQVLYRLKLKGNQLPWDIVVNVESQIGKEKVQEMKESFREKKTSIKSDTGIKNDTDTSIKSDTGISIKSDTDVESETLGTVGENPSLNKGLNKVLNKTSSSRESIDSELKEQFPNAPFEEIKEKLLNDETAVIDTDMQYKRLLEYRLSRWVDKPSKQPKTLNKGKRTPIRTELLPEWFDGTKDKFIESLKGKTLDELITMREKVKDYPKQASWLEERIQKIENIEVQQLEIERMMAKLRS